MHRLAALALAAGLAAPLAARAAPRTEITWYGHSAFVVTTPHGTVLAIDPWLSNPKDTVPDAAEKLKKVDYILVTHGHFDHVGDAIAIAKRTGAKFVGSYELAQALVGAGYPKDQATMATAGNIGGTIPLGDDASVTLVPALHSSGFQKDPSAPVEYAGNPVGFVIQIAHGPTLYHTGDTDVMSDMRLIGERFHVDYLLACIGGHFTMGPRGAAAAAVLTRAKVVIPMHFGTFPVLTGTPAELEKELKAVHAKAKMLLLPIGEPRPL